MIKFSFYFFLYIFLRQYSCVHVLLLLNKPKKKKKPSSPSSLLLRNKQNQKISENKIS